MKRIITIVVIMLAMVSVAMGQKTSKEIDNMYYTYRLADKGKIEKVYGNSDRTRFDAGDYTLTRRYGKKCEGKQTYIVSCDPAEVKALKEHFESNRQYYNDNYGFIITDIKCWYWSGEFELEVFFPDWDELQKEAEAKKKAEKQKRIESINW